MEFIYLIKAFDSAVWHEFIPNPGVFKTEREAEFYCDTFNKEHDSISYMWERIPVGVMKVPKKWKIKRIPKILF